MSDIGRCTSSCCSPPHSDFPPFPSRELGEPFDFLTWFEYAPSETPRFDELLTKLRDTEEWRYVEREVHVRLALGR